ncbi:MAG: hypothetical protein MR433_03275 [Coriobacteriaceae bacterium]|nr:hypothetical protein [Coriobacteriaceae bacterium]MDD7110545.1 hypothetical protein [Coriobacteriaceae bacterium]MDY5808190.1 hypothetical protein [Coriobacteriales bacterium]
MRLFGDNSKYGDTEIELADGKRTVGVKVEDGKAFPEGVAGLIPVVTKRKKGGTKTVYAFPTKEGDSGELEQTDELAVITDGVDLINRLLAQAAELARIELGQIFGVTMAITPENYNFTRVEIVPIDAHNKPSETPVHLHIETSEEPCEPGSLSCVIELDGEGVPARVLICEYNERNATLRINVNVNEKTGKLSVQKVEDIMGSEARLLYKRGWTPQGAQYVAARKEGREGGERGGKFVRKTGRAVSRDQRDSFDGEREGRFEKSSHRNRFDDERDGGRGERSRGGKPARRDEVPGMRRIDGSPAKRGGTHRDRDDRRSRDFDDRPRGERRYDDRGDRDYSERRYDERHSDDRRSGSRDYDDRRSGGYDDRGSRGGERRYDDRSRGGRDGGSNGRPRSNGGSRGGNRGNGGSRRSY